MLRDVGRVLQMPYGQVDKLCKLVPQQSGQSGDARPRRSRASRSCRRRATRTRWSRGCCEIAQKLEGLYRHASTHAAGIVIGDRPLDELVPLYRDPKSDMPVTQFNMKMVEAAGLVKFDFLGLKTLTVLQKAVDLIKRGRGIEVDLATLPLDDAQDATICWRKADTVGVFQLESTGMRESLKRLKPDRFEDIIAMVALYRPGPMDNIPTYINRKHGEEPVDYLHPMLEAILKETYGVIIYQEQVMQIAQVLARLFARRRRPVAPRHGQERQGRDGAAAGALRRGRDEERRQEGRRGLHLRTGRQVRRLRLQQVATRPPMRWSATTRPI